MRIGVNARRLSGQRLGIGRYLEYLIKYWDSNIGPEDTVVLYTQRPVSLPFEVSDAIRIVPLGPRATGSVWENVALPRRSSDVDVLFGPSYTAPIVYGGRSVVATHSVNEVQAGTHPWWYRYTYTPWYRRSARSADRVIVPSASTKADVESYYGIPGDRIDVVPEGADDSFAPHNDPELNRATRIRHLGTDVPYILFVGKFSQRRNIPMLIEAFSRLKKQDAIPHRLFLVGPNPLGLPLREISESFGVSEDVVQTDGRWDDHRELVLIYNAADLYAYPSAYDGFSLTLVEAMGCGVPVVTVNRAAIAEIANGSALLIEEPEVDALTDAMRRALTDAELRATLRAKGLERASTLRLSNTARGTLDVLRRVAGS